MTDQSEFTKEQIKAWRAYERVRAKGAYNMFDPRARAATGLSKEEFLFCMEHYSALQEAAMPETTTPMTKASIQFACEQLREWGGLSEAEIQRIYDAEMRRMKEIK